MSTEADIELERTKVFHAVQQLKDHGYDIESYNLYKKWGELTKIARALDIAALDDFFFDPDWDSTSNEFIHHVAEKVHQSGEISDSQLSEYKAKADKAAKDRVVTRKEWHDAGQGLTTIKGIIEFLENAAPEEIRKDFGLEPDWASGLVTDLRRWGALLEYAKDTEQRFRVFFA